MGTVESMHEETNDILDNYLVHYEPNDNNNITINSLIDRIKYLEINYKKQQEEINNLKNLCKKLENKNNKNINTKNKNITYI